ncbi:MAG: DUF1573 domain-containing protein [Flavobacteriales bacterium]
MFRGTILGIVLSFAWSSFIAQNHVVFNKTEHDFSTIGQSEVPFEQDFLFRNTGEGAIKIMSVRSISNSLSFIHTRSEVFKGEYGFVKVKFRTDSLTGLFHDEVYITMRLGDDVLSEVLYLRANVTPNGGAGPKREFKDSEIATSVEVSPSDIESLEGFGAQDRLASAEAEIGYLKKQLGLKSELISKLSDDLRIKQTKEAENIQRLQDLERSVRTDDGTGNQAILLQITELSTRLVAIQESDKQLRQEIFNQEAEFNNLRQEADSARAYAESLSKQLENQFKAEARAIEKAYKLEQDLESKRKLEQEQQQTIDSLQQAIATASESGNGYHHQIEKLKAELNVRLKEQDLQTAHARLQHDKIEELKLERQRLAMQTDSLDKNLKLQQIENTKLHAQLSSTERRIKGFESQIDSLSGIASNLGNDHASKAELDSLQQVLVLLRVEDTRLKSSINSKDEELKKLQAERVEKEKNLKALENASNRQLEETHNLMYRINQLSEKESKARMEIASLQGELNTSQLKAATYRTQANELESKLSNAKMSNELAFTELNEDVQAMRIERDDYRQKYQQAMKEIDRLSDELAESNSERDNARMAVKELGITPKPKSISSASPISYKVNLVTSDKPLKRPPANLDQGDLYTFQENGKYNYAIGNFETFKEAITLKECMKSKGYPTAHIICFRGSERISLKEALETASSY